jgi:hypothetical protein
MKETNTEPQPRDPDDAIRERILERAKAINDKLFTRLGIVDGDLEVGMHRAALGGLDGIEREIDSLLGLLLLLP